MRMGRWGVMERITEGEVPHLAGVHQQALASVEASILRLLDVTCTHTESGLDSLLCASCIEAIKVLWLRV